jgi:hypothetical protein
MVEEKKEISDFLKNMRACYQTACDEPYSNYIDVGINDPPNNEPFEIYVDVELFEEKLKPENESDIQCPYYGDHLGEELTRLLKETAVDCIINHDQTNFTQEKMNEIELQKL